MIEQSRLFLKNCRLMPNRHYKGQPLKIQEATPWFDDLTISFDPEELGTNGYAGSFDTSHVTLNGDLTVSAGQMIAKSTWFTGPGSLVLADDTRLDIIGESSNNPTVSRCSIKGTGDIYIGSGQNTKSRTRSSRRSKWDDQHDRVVLILVRHPNGER